MHSLTRAILQNNDLTPLPASVEGGTLPALVSGLSSIHRANLAAALRLETGRPVFVICPDEAAAEAMARDLRAFLGEEVQELTSRDFTFYSAEGVSRQAEQRRLAVLDALDRGQSPVTVCTISGLMQRTLGQQMLRQASFTIDFNTVIAPEKVEEKLLLCGYTRRDLVEGPGQFSRRGGILDFFSPAYRDPVRVEFWGNEIDSMAFFSIDSQRRTENIKSCRILPASETLPTFYPGGTELLAEKLMQLSRKTQGKGGFGKLADTLREDAERLRETGHIAAADRYMKLINGEMYTALDFVPEDALVFMDQPGKVQERAAGYMKQTAEDVKLLIQSGTLAGSLAEFILDWDDVCRRLEDFPVVMADPFRVGRYPLEPRRLMGLLSKQLPSYGGSAETAAGDVQHYLSRNFRIVILARDEHRVKVLHEFFMERDIKCAIDIELKELPPKGVCSLAVGSLSAGFEYPDINLAVLTDAQFIQAGFRKAKRKKALSGRERLDSCADLAVGDLVVHEYHGIGRFAGIFKIPVDGVEKDYIKISYAGTDSLYVPATQLDLVSKYIGGGEDKPVRLSKLGGSDWQRTKSRAKAAAKELARNLVALYAQRQRMRGHAFASDSPWQIELEEKFGYQETEDQLRCIEEIKRDMEKPVPMDRLLCGDVGYGKTEVAFRAVMKCVLEGKQAAILVPTTVLAQQHYQTALQRFFGYPIRIDLLSRFRTPAQIRQTLRDLKSGLVDIVIGTHRLLQKDVLFKDLGLLVVDEEQRFGVAHKEHIKEMSRQVDVLTLSATPIPRTLNMALSGIKDMSTIEEPPQDRLPVQTYVMEHDWEIVCDAIRREIQRGGQVYYLHNRIDNIERTALRIANMLEGVSVGVAHGQMDEESLSNVMENMVEGKIQVLVCTTIIETGIDIPNVNTLIIEDADKLGLAQLHQIRGRVGRSSRRASAYLTFRKNKALSEVAEKRLSAIREFAEFNSGFKIAMRDLEIRGAGNLLGPEQSGHMIAVGYDMYLKLLEEAVLEERGEKPEVRAECSADLAVSANIPESYVPSSEQRMDLYRRIALIRTEEEADDLTDELIDRFGDPPPAVNALIHVALLRGEATRAEICDISQKDGYLRFVLTDFEMARVSTLYGQAKFKGRIKVEAGSKPCLRLKLKSGRHIIKQAREFVEAYAATKDFAQS
ncbi:MAG TPA: transcription-repair coupling factor [Clostridiales bacterium]|nr:transcription-repair coupling factor [Clostridiales bacterium]